MFLQIREQQPIVNNLQLQIALTHVYNVRYKYHDSVKSLFQVVVNINCDLHQMSSTYLSIGILLEIKVRFYISKRKKDWNIFSLYLHEFP